MYIIYLKYECIILIINVIIKYILRIYKCTRRKVTFCLSSVEGGWFGRRGGVVGAPVITPLVAVGFGPFRAPTPRHRRRRYTLESADATTTRRVSARRIAATDAYLPWYTVIILGTTVTVVWSLKPFNFCTGQWVTV